MNLWQKLNSYLFPILIERNSNALHQELSVYAIKGKMSLHTDQTNYSFGRLHKVFQQAFKRIDIQNINPKKVLILGFGTGSIAYILTKEMKLQPKITGIEKDPDIITLGKKYFDCDGYANTEIICADASEYIRNSSEKFDLIICDLFIEREVPSEFETASFFKACSERLQDKGKLLFNKIVYEKQHKNSLTTNEKHINKYFSKQETFRVKNSNRIIVAEI